MPEESLTNAAWKKLFNHFQIATHLQSQGIYRISAANINRIGKREPRLMTKFDSRKSRPRTLSDQQVTILPVTNGEYVLLSGDGYCTIPLPANIERYDPTRMAELQTLSWREGLHSEPQVIDTLYGVSALRSFVGDDSLALTIRGKLRSHPFTFAFNTTHGLKQLHVDGAQIEVDSGYEGKCVVIIEAKFGWVEDLIIRQLYYPYRHFLEAGVTKTLRLAFLLYSNKVFSIYEVAFEDQNYYQSARIVRQKHYTFEEVKRPPTFADVVASKIHKRLPSSVPFPQADDASKILDVVELLSSNPMSKSEIAEYFEVDPRQGDYYGNAAAWLGFAQKSAGLFNLTPRGRELATLNRSDRLTRLAEEITAMPIFFEAARQQIRGSTMSLKEIATLIEKRTNLKGSTPPRRASTVRSWIDWLNAQLPGRNDN